MNSAENFFSILWLGVFSTYHHWSPAHMRRYLAEFDFRHSTRDISDAECSTELLRELVGKRLYLSADSFARRLSTTLPLVESGSARSAGFSERVYMAEPLMTEDQCEIFGTLTAFQFMLENLYASVIAADGGTVDDARETRDDMLRQFEELPSRNRGELQPEGDYLVSQFALARLERMWQSILARLEQ